MTFAADEHIVLTVQESANIREAVQTCKYDPGESSSYLSSLRRIAYSSFPERVLDAIERVKRSACDALGSLQIHKPPIDPAITGSPRFIETGRSFKEGVLIENVLVALGAVTGEPYSIAHERGELARSLSAAIRRGRPRVSLGSAGIRCA